LIYHDSTLGPASPRRWCTPARRTAPRDRDVGHAAIQQLAMRLIGVNMDEHAVGGLALLQLRVGSSSFNGLMLPRVAYEENTVIFP
jgi:hypothetical protein